MGQKIDYMLYILTALNPQNNTGGYVLVLTLQVKELKLICQRSL